MDEIPAGGCSYIYLEGDFSLAWETDRHMRAPVKCTNNLAIQKFRSLANWIFHGVYDFVNGVVRQAAALVFLGSRVKVKRGGEIWTILMANSRRLSSGSVAIYRHSIQVVA